MSNGKKDTSPMIKARRIKRPIRIQEVNNPPSSVFDVTVEYASDDLPEWFWGLQPIVEDETFTSMEITLGGGRVKYLITLGTGEQPVSECHGSARCDARQVIEMSDGAIITTTVHNVHLVRSIPDPYYRGFLKAEDGRITVTKPLDADVWKEVELGPHSPESANYGAFDDEL